MKRSFKNSFFIILILISLIAGGVRTIPAYAAGSSMAVVSLDLPTGWTYGYLSGLWGSGASDVYAAGYGYNGSTLLPLMYHRDSSNWTVSNLSLPIGLNSGILYGVWGSNAADVYVAGEGFKGAAFLPLLFHWNGSSWTDVSPSLPAGWSSGNFKRIWGSAANDVYAVGSGSKGGTFLPLLYHWNGSTWTEASPTLPTGWSSGYLSGLWGSSTTDVYTVGYGLSGSSNVPLLYHWNGSTWTEASPSLPIGWNSDYLSGVWGSSASNVYAVGYGHNGSVNWPMLYHSS